ncbi:MAG: hypothetical protein ACREJ4_05600 [Candidatus Methylomirabilaceae bacterium]
MTFFALHPTSLSLLVLLSLQPVPRALADQHRSAITPQERRTARDLFDNRTEDLSGHEQRLLREIRSGEKRDLTSEERALFDRIQRKLPDVEGRKGDE